MTRKVLMLACVESFVSFHCNRSVFLKMFVDVLGYPYLLFYFSHNYLLGIYKSPHPEGRGLTRVTTFVYRFLMETTLSSTPKQTVILYRCNGRIRHSLRFPLGMQLQDHFQSI